MRCRPLSLDSHPAIYTSYRTHDVGGCNPNKVLCDGRCRTSVHIPKLLSQLHHLCPLPPQYDSQPLDSTFDPTHRHCGRCAEQIDCKLHQIQRQRSVTRVPGKHNELMLRLKLQSGYVRLCGYTLYHPHIISMGMMDDHSVRTHTQALQLDFIPDCEPPRHRTTC